MGYLKFRVSISKKRLYENDIYSLIFTTKIISQKSKKNFSINANMLSLNSVLQVKLFF